MPDGTEADLLGQSGARRVVISGMGLVTPLGVGLREPWEALVRGDSGIGPITRFDASDLRVRVAAEVHGFDPRDFMTAGDVKRGDLFIQYATAAAVLALSDAGLEGIPEGMPASRFGCIVGVGFGGLPVLEAKLEKGPVPVFGMRPYQLPSILPNLAAGTIAARYGLQGPCLCPATACSAGVHAVGDAYRLVRDGTLDAALCGGAEGTICRIAVQGFGAMRALSTREEPGEASRPFDYRRDGFVLGEGAGILLLESLESATRRDARVYAEVVGFGMSGDGHHITAPDPQGDGAYRCMAMAVEMAEASAGLSPSSFGYVNAHGTSTPHNDFAEVRAIVRLFGSHAYEMAVSSTKSAIGHLLGGAGGVETVFTALALHDGVLPPTLNFGRADDPDDPDYPFTCDPDLDYVPGTARQAQVEAALCNAFGFGGTNGCVALRRWQD